MATMTCPSNDRLAAFQAGRLSHDDLNAIASHVERCGACLTVLERVSTLKDTLVKELQLARGASPFITETNCRRVIAQIAAQQSDATATRDDTADSEPSADLERRALGKYQLLEKIGQGGMGTVYKAFHTLLKRVVALKVLPPNRLKDPLAVSRFRREIEAAGRLDHLHIVRTSDADEADGQHFLVMEWLAGQDLAKYVRERGPLPIEEACDFMRQAALGLECAHQHGMVHRDVKPSNLLVTPGANGVPLVKVLDLGLALLHAPDSTNEDLTSADRVMGTYDYIAPEQAMNAHEVDARADIYSLGCTFYFLLAGRAPFQGRTETQKLLAHQRDNPPPIASIRTDVPTGVLGVLNKMIAKEPAQRFASMREVAEALQTPPNIPIARHAPPQRRRAPLFAVAVALLVLLIGGVTLVPQILLRIKGKDGDIELKLPKDVGFDATKDKKIIASVTGDGKLVKEDAKNVNDANKKPDNKTPPAPNVGEIRRYLGHQDGIRCLAYSPDGKAFLSGSSGELWLWDVDHATERVRFPNTQGNIQSAVFSHDGAHVIGPAQVGSVVLWETKVAPGEKVRELARFQIPGWVECLGVAPDRPHVFYSNRSGGRIYDLDKKAELPTRFLGEQAVLSKSGRRLLSADGRSLYLWDVGTGKEVNNVDLPGAAFRVALAADGRHALACVGKDVYHWDMDEKKPGKRLSTPSSVLALAIATDGQHALTGGFDHKLRLWDLSTGKELQCFDGHARAVTSVAFAPDGLQALSGSDDKTIRLWQMPVQFAQVEPKKKDPSPASGTGPLRLEIVTKLGIRTTVEVRDFGLSESQASALRQLLFSRVDTGDYLRKSATSETSFGRICLDQGNSAYLFIPIQQIVSIEADDKLHVATLTDGRKLKGRLLSTVTAKGNTTQQLSDAKTVKVLIAKPELPAETPAPASRLTWSGTSMTLSSYRFHAGPFGFGEKIRMIVNGEKLEPLLSDFDKAVVATGAAGEWRIALTAPGGQETAGILDTETARGPRWYLLAETHNGWLVLLAYNNGNPGFTLEKLDAKTAAKNEKRSLKAEHSGGITDLSVSRDGTKVLTYTSDKYLWFWEQEADKSALKLRWKSKPPLTRGIALDPSGTIALLAIGGSSYLYQANTQTGDVAERRKGRHDGASGLLFSADGRRYLAADFYGRISLRDTQEGEVLRKFTGHSDSKGVRTAPQVCFSSDGERILSSGEDHTVRLWDSTNAEELKEFAFPAMRKRVIALSPKGTQALISQDNNVQVWDLSTGKVSAELKGHKDHVTAVAYGPDGSWAVSASQDKTLRVWDIASAMERSKLEGHTDDVSCLAVTADGTIFSGSRDKTLRVWARPK